MREYTGEFEISVDGVDEPITAIATCIFETAMEDLPSHPDGPGRGSVEVITGSTLYSLTMEPITYDRAGAIDFIGIKVVEAIESYAIKRECDL